MAMIKEHREAKGLTQVELAKLAGVSRSLLAEWETNPRKVPNERRLRELAAALGLSSVQDLFALPNATLRDPDDLDAAIMDALGHVSDLGKAEALQYLDFLASRFPRDAEGTEEAQPGQIGSGGEPGE